MNPGTFDPALNREQCADIVARVMKFVSSTSGGTKVRVYGWRNNELRWARNRVSVASERRDIVVTVVRSIGLGDKGVGKTNQIDDDSLRGVIRLAERRARESVRLEKTRNVEALEGDVPRPTPTIWSDNTTSVASGVRGEIARALITEAEERQMLSAGYLELRSASRAEASQSIGNVLASFNDHAGQSAMLFEQWTQAQCSMTVRHPKGLGSGWAGLSSFDWGAINAKTLATRALEKCIASLNPVRIEPGRYTVILECQPVSQLVEVLMKQFARPAAEAYRPQGPFGLESDPDLRTGRSKLGLQVVDERITISHDPMDPALGVLPDDGLTSITWIEHGILTTLHRSHQQTRWDERNWLGPIDRKAFRMSGGDATMSEMISSTKRGILVTQFSNLKLIDRTSVLVTGLTRNGLWLIENGTISKAVHNMRFTESPLFILNQVEQLGIPQPVFRPVIDPYHEELTPAIVPPIKATDFSFTALIDAI